MQADVPTVLLVEDVIQCVAEDSLSDAGLSPTVVASAEEALGLLEEAEPQYRALITDIDLGRQQMDGWQRGAANWRSLGVPKSVLVTKPFAPAQLVNAVWRLLNAGAAPA